MICALHSGSSVLGLQYLPSISIQHHTELSFIGLLNAKKFEKDKEMVANIGGQYSYSFF